MSDGPRGEFFDNRAIADAKYEVADELRRLIEAEGHSAYLSSFDEQTEADGFPDTFEVTFVIGLAPEANPLLDDDESEADDDDVDRAVRRVEDRLSRKLQRLSTR